MAQDTFELAVWDRLDGVPDPSENRMLVGHVEALARLASRYASGRMHHAWMISGPSGIGKATLALRFAGHVFRHPDAGAAPQSYVLPPGDDPVESRVGRGGHPNLLHLRRGLRDDGRNRRTQLTVEEVRRTIRLFGKTRAEDGYRVAIVDPADDLNANAANALLKILEEPPARTLFLVIANSPGAMLATIRSRCQFLQLRPLANDEVAAALHSSGISSEASEADLALAISLSGGSVRRAILILREGGSDLHRRMVGLIGAKETDWAAIHALAAELAPVANAGRYRLLIELVHDFVARRVRGEAEPGRQTPQPDDVSSLARWVEVWEKTRRCAELAEAYNLDRKQVILNLFSAIREAA